MQALIIKTLFEAARRAFWKNGSGKGVVADVLTVKHDSEDPLVHNETARALAWLLRGLVVIALVKVAQLVGFDITPYLHDILRMMTEQAAETAG